MKKKLLLILILFIPLIVNAKEYCKVESGNLNTIGSEISCGNEHFYIIDSNENEVKMLAKYNLYVGANYDKIKVDSNTYVYIECEDPSCANRLENYLLYFEGSQIENEEIFYERIKEKYNLDSIYNYINNEKNSAVIVYVPNYEEKETIDGKTYIKGNVKLYPYTVINTETNGFAMQNELALGVTGAKGNANYPIYATLPVFPGNYDNYGHFVNTDGPEESTKDYDNFEDGYINFEFNENSRTNNYLNEYKNRLNNIGYEVSNVDMINIKELNELIKKVSGNTLPLSNWYRASLNSDYIEDDGLEYKDLGDLKEYLTNDYKWLWNTTYWTKTFVGNIEEQEESYFNQLYFISSSGEICYSYSDCWSSIPRAGLRPTVTIAKENIKYNIRTKTDGNGTIEVVDKAAGGEVISFKVSAKKGLKLAGLTVTTDSQEKVQFNEEDLTTNKDGTVSISTNKFTMPYENVTIEARWATTINPLTVSSIFIFFLILIASVCIIFRIYTKKKEKKG